MIAAVKVNASGEAILEHTSDDVNDIRRWLRSFRLEVVPTLGWVNADKSKQGAIYHDRTPGAYYRGVIWIKA